ncbi:50S ribosomal protein L33 [Coxiella-like endosymbiont]|uniref:50S ribosomal protein L33 n=1 Tax=Coxiella-like endosymbiont TaxID=1592897 RepID=UPI002729DBB1|nr:50S ribosomal protein L33 [Coxiella-like endosymbiont]
MAVSPREKIMLQSTGKTKAGKPTGTYYTTTKNKRNTGNIEGKLSIKKFDPRAWNPETGKCGMHVAFKEKKIPK